MPLAVTTDRRGAGKKRVAELLKRMCGRSNAVIGKKARNQHSDGIDALLVIGSGIDIHQDRQEGHHVVLSRGYPFEDFGFPYAHRLALVFSRAACWK